MKLKELIKQLQKYDENLEVWIRDEFGRESDLWEDEIFVSKLYNSDSDKEVLIIQD